MIAFGTDTSLNRAAGELGIVLDAERREHVANEQLRMVLEHTRIGTLAATAFALLAALPLHGSVGLGAVKAWLVAKVVVAAARIALAQVHRRRGSPGGAFWRRTTYAFLAVDGAVWGVAGLRLAAEAEPLAALVTAALACITCVATFGLQVRSVATAAYVAPILGLNALGLAWRGDEFGLFGAAGLAILLVLQVLTAHGAQQRLAQGVLLRLQAQALADEKEAALQLAQHQSAVKSQFLAKISHELRTPLHGILGLARLVHQEQSDPAVARRVELIEASGKHLLALINDLLDISRLDAGQFTMRAEPFDLAAQCEALADVAVVRASEKGLTLALDMALPQPCWVTGDAARFRQVMHNLLGNALKFTRHGRIDVRVARDAVDAALLRVEVVDTGDGIAEADLAHVFEAFHQGDRASDEPIEGAGLGLTIAREIAQSMGGDVTVSSRLGAGSCFVFTCALAAARVRGRRRRPGTRHRTCHARVGARRRGRRSQRRHRHGLPRRAGRRPRTRARRPGGGRAGAAHADRPELVLMDWRMPGWTACRRHARSAPGSRRSGWRARRSSRSPR